MGPLGAPETLLDVLESRAREASSAPLFTFLTDDGEEAGMRSGEELLGRSRAGAVRLREVCQPGDRAVVLAPPGLDYIDALFSCLAAGVYAVPAYPPDPMRLGRTVPRLAAIVRDARPQAILTISWLRDLAAPALELAPELGDIPWIAIDETDPRRGDEYVRPAIARTDPAYLQYTSGSTADPRGAIVTHDNILRHVPEIIAGTGRPPGFTVVSWMPPYHDFGLLGALVMPLLGRGRSVLLSPLAFLRSPVVWLRALSTHRGTTTQAATFALELCLRKIDPRACRDVDLSTVDMIAIGGEPIRVEAVRRFEKAFAPLGLRPGTFAPGYGMAEATLVLSGRGPAPLAVRNLRASALRRGRVVEVSARSADSVEIAGCGPLFPSNELIVVDPETRRPAAAGHVGELWGAGPGVCPGYWERPEETREVFGAHLADGRGPFLRTGDLGFVDAGEVFVTGRLKDVILVRGQNHYPQDLELSVEGSHPALRAGCTAAFALATDGVDRVVVAAEVRPGDDLDPQAVAAAVRAAVARDHGLHVSSVVLLPPGGLPKTSSGKVQRQPCRQQLLDGSLEVLTRVDDTRTVFGASLGTTAPKRDDAGVLAWLIAHFAEVLDLDDEEVPADARIAALGIDSLAAVSLLEAVEARFGCSIPVSSFFEEATLRDLAGFIAVAGVHDGAAKDRTAPPSTRGDAEYPLSHGQRGLWFLSRLAPESSAYNLAHAVRMRGPLDAAALERAFLGLLARHEALRCTFHRGADGRLLQRVHPSPSEILERRSAAGMSDHEVATLVNGLAATPFDLEARPPFRAVLLERSAEESVLVLVAHHLVADFSSLMVANRELRALLAAACEATEAELAAPRGQHRDYIRAEQELLSSPRAERLWRYWDEQLAGDLPLLELPADRPRPALQSFAGGVVRMTLARELGDRVRRCARATATTPFVVLLAAFQSLLHRLSGQPEVIVGSPLAMRRRHEWSDLVGYLANPLPLRARFHGGPTFGDLLARTRIGVLSAIDHQEAPFPLLVERRSPPRDASRSPIFQAMFALLRAADGAGAGLLPPPLVGGEVRRTFGDLTLESWPLVERGGAQCDLAVTAVENEGMLDLVWEYDAALFDHATIERFAASYRTLLSAAADLPDMPVADLPLLDAAARRFVVDECNATARELPGDVAVHRLIAARLKRAPDRPAVRSGSRWTTAGGLCQRAEQVTRALHGAGVARGSRVGILLDRSADMVAAFLGTLAAGAAYVPLDPAQPVRRLRSIVEDASVDLLLADEQTAAIAGELAVRVLRTDALPSAAELRAPAIDTPDEVAADGSDAAYVIYTSGSTGKPKGVEITHRSLANLLLAMQEAPGLGTDDTLLAVTTVSFDIAALEIFLPLLVGARLVVAPGGETADGAALARALEESGATAMQATPASWRMLIGAGWQGGPDFKVLCGGDALSRDLADALLARSGSVWNLYGPTETTIWSAIGRVVPGGGPVPVGTPIANTQMHVLDDRLAPLPIGVPGELYIGGFGLARGYVGLAELTAERFVSGPAALGGRLYRTGDLARRRIDGAIEILGRSDRQVKVRGFRIELAEIEHALVSHPAITDGVVVPFGEGDRCRLAAYVVPRDGGGDVAALGPFLAERLPHYMVPSFIVPLERLPLTHAGKIDRRKLPDPERGAPPVKAGSTAPHTDRERLLLEIWRQVLGIAEIGIEDDFFALGGDSLGAADLVARIASATGHELDVRELLAHPTVAALARHLGTVVAVDHRAEPATTSGRPSAEPIAPAFIEIERRPLLGMFAAGRIPPVDAAALAYLPASLVATLEMSQDEALDVLFGGLPLVSGVLSTSLGRIGLILLPHFDDRLHERRAELCGSIREGAEVARQIGARSVSLTGLLPALTDHGRDLGTRGGAPLARSGPSPQLTTGHATTAATVVLSIARTLAESGRDLSRETVAFLGLGSIGLASLRLLLSSLGEPERILLCDLYRKRDHLGAIRRELIDAFGVTARIDTLETREELPDELYQASLIVGATNAAGVLDVARLRPYTLIVDDSAPHCFDRPAAEKRLRERGDVLFTEGGVLQAPEPIPRLLHLPRGAEALAGLLPSGLPGMPGVARADEITGCVLSSLLSTRFPDLGPTIGEVTLADSRRHYERLQALGFRGAPLHCEGFSLPAESVARFRSGAAAEISSPG